MFSSYRSSNLANFLFPSFNETLCFHFLSLQADSKTGGQRERNTYLLVCLWCWMTIFFSWMVSSRAVARDFRSEMDCGVAGRLQPWSSDNNSWTAKKREKQQPWDDTHIKSILLFKVTRQNKPLRAYSHHMCWAICPIVSVHTNRYVIKKKKKDRKRRTERSEMSFCNISIDLKEKKGKYCDA